MYDLKLDLKLFENYLRGHGLSTRWIRDIIRYARRYGYLLSTSDVELAAVLAGLQPGARRKVMAALTWLARFLGIEKEWVRRRKRFARWRRTPSLPHVFSNLDELLDAITRVARVIEPPRFRVFVAFLLATGLRPSEAVYAWRKYWVLRATTPKGAILLRLELLRRTKHALIALVHTLVDERVPARTTLGYTLLRVRWNRACEAVLRGKRIPLSMLRKIHATLLLRNGLREWEVDLLQGRLEGITRRHYIIYSIDDIWPRYLRALEKPLAEILA